MAYTSVIPVRRLDRAVKYVMNKEKTTAVSLQDALDYAANRDKTEQSCFESSYACTLETAFADIRTIRSSTRFSIKRAMRPKNRRLICISRSTTFPTWRFPRSILRS